MSNIKNAKIKSTMLGVEDHGILTAFLHLDYGGAGQGFGGYGLGGPFCSAWVERVLETVGVEKWEDLPGKHIRVKAEHSKVHEIGNILEDKWFNPAEEFKNFDWKKIEEIMEKKRQN